LTVDLVDIAIHLNKQDILLQFTFFYIMQWHQFQVL